jgi:hypothetical protein
VSNAFRAEYDDAAVKAQAALLRDHKIEAAQMARVQQILGEIRAHH